MSTISSLVAAADTGVSAVASSTSTPSSSLDRLTSDIVFHVIGGFMLEDDAAMKLARSSRTYFHLFRKYCGYRLKKQVPSNHYWQQSLGTIEETKSEIAILSRDPQGEADTARKERIIRIKELRIRSYFQLPAGGNGDGNAASGTGMDSIVSNGISQFDFVLRRFPYRIGVLSHVLLQLYYCPFDVSRFYLPATLESIELGHFGSPFPVFDPAIARSFLQCVPFPSRLRELSFGNGWMLYEPIDWFRRHGPVHTSDTLTKIVFNLAAPDLSIMQSSQHSFVWPPNLSTLIWHPTAALVGRSCTLLMPSTLTALDMRLSDLETDVDAASQGLLVLPNQIRDLRSLLELKLSWFYAPPAPPSTTYGAQLLRPGLISSRTLNATLGALPLLRSLDLRCERCDDSYSRQFQIQIEYDEITGMISPWILPKTLETLFIDVPINLTSPTDRFIRHKATPESLLQYVTGKGMTIDAFESSLSERGNDRSPWLILPLNMRNVQFKSPLPKDVTRNDVIFAQASAY